MFHYSIIALQTLTLNSELSIADFFILKLSLGLIRFTLITSITKAEIRVLAYIFCAERNRVTDYDFTEFGVVGI